METAVAPVYPQLFPGRKPVWQERAAAKDANGIASVIMAETARTVIICFFMVKPPVMQNITKMLQEGFCHKIPRVELGMNGKSF